MKPIPWANKETGSVISACPELFPCLRYSIRRFGSRWPLEISDVTPDDDRNTAGQFAVGYGTEQLGPAGTFLLLARPGYSAQTVWDTLAPGRLHALDSAFSSQSRVCAITSSMLASLPRRQHSQIVRTRHPLWSSACWFRASRS